MKWQRFMLAALVVAGAWSLTLGTVAVVHLGRLVDTLTLATAAPPASTAPAGFEALPVEWSADDTAALDRIAAAVHDGLLVSVYLHGTDGLERALCAIARAIDDSPAQRFTGAPC